MKVGGKPNENKKDFRVDWESVADRLREHPGEDVLLDEFVDTSRVRALSNSVRQGDIVALFELGGVVFPSMRNSRSIGGSRRRGDVWLRWEPDADPLAHYAERSIERARVAGRLKEVA